MPKIMRYQSTTEVLLESQPQAAAPVWIEDDDFRLRIRPKRPVARTAGAGFTFTTTSVVAAPNITRATIRRARPPRLEPADLLFAPPAAAPASPAWGWDDERRQPKPARIAVSASELLSPPQLLTPWGWEEERQAARRARSAVVPLRRLLRIADADVHVAALVRPVLGWEDEMAIRVVQQIKLGGDCIFGLSGAAGAGSPPPNVPTLAVTDNADGTGATATVSGGSSDADHKIYVGSFLGGLGTIPKTLAGQRTGNGTVSLPLAVGYYIGMIEAERSDDIVAGNTVYFAVTDGLDPVHYRFMLGLQADIRSLALSGIPGDNVVLRWLPRPRERDANGAMADPMPLVIISPAPQELELPGLNATDDISYPCLVTFWDTKPDLNTNLQRNLLWRQKVYRRLRWKRVAGVGESEYVQVFPELITDPGAWGANYWLDALLARCVSREPRG